LPSVPRELRATFEQEVQALFYKWLVENTMKEPRTRNQFLLQFPAMDYNPNMPYK
jgi:hypothetical protein